MGSFSSPFCAVAPKTWGSVRRTALIGLLLLGGICSAQAAESTDPFPQCEAIAGNVDFWTSVYAVWERSQVAVHDLEHLALVYEVVDLPGPVESRYTEEQRDFLDDLNEAWKRRLLALERRVEKGEELDEADRALALKIATTIGTDGLRDAGSRVRTQRGLRDRFHRSLEISQRYDVLLREIFREAGLPEELAYLPHVESAFQATARSSAGALGIWQFTRGTGKRFMRVNSSVDERLDPIAAAYAAAAYLRLAYDKLGDWPIALTSYNHGVAGMARAAQKHGNDYERIFSEYKGRSFGFASRNFYSEFLAARRVARDPLKYFPEGLTPEAPFDLEAVRLEHRTTPARLAAAYDLALAQMARLNPAWTDRTVRNGRSLPAGLNVWLPRGTLERIADKGHKPEYAVSGPVAADGRYVVERGDTLSTIARRHKMNIAELRSLNGMNSRQSLIRVGQELEVVGGGQRVAFHVVRRGESLSSIASAYGSSTRSLRELNSIAAGNDIIQVGQRLRVHDRKQAPAHVVRRGDTLMKIALNYGVGLTDLLVHNQLRSTSTIYPGQRIAIP